MCHGDEEADKRKWASDDWHVGRGYLFNWSGVRVAKGDGEIQRRALFLYWQRPDMLNPPTFFFFFRPFFFFFCVCGLAASLSRPFKHGCFFLVSLQVGIWRAF